MMENTKRNYQIDILRILAMYFVVFQHLITHSGLLDNLVLGTREWFIWNYLYACARVAVNCFVLITGFFYDHCSHGKSKIPELWIKTWIYSFTIAAIFRIFGECTVIEMIKAAIPIITKEYWFVTVYLVLCFFKKYINRLIDNMEKKEYDYLIIGMTIIFVIWKSAFPFLSTLDDTGGFGILWFSYLYILAAYLKKYGYIYIIKKWNWLILYFTCMVVVTLVKWMLSMLRMDTLASCFYGYNTLFMLVASISLFAFFAYNYDQEKENKPYMQKIVKWIAPVVFDIYLLSEQNNVREILFTKVFPMHEMQQRLSVCSFIIYSVTCTFLICTSAVIIGHGYRTVYNIIYKYYRKKKGI